MQILIALLWKFMSVHPIKRPCD